ncbi:MAG: SGNH/GDSL hydrolase family protein [Opitutaceae bacterium]|nr:SGNH/GDSL hydrolase family protein [Opitutaceae bacterium]
MNPSPRPDSRIRHATFTLALCLAAAAPLLAAPAKWTAAIDKFTQADATRAPAPGGIVFVGSSSIVKWTTLTEDFPGLPVINRGFGGSELEDSLFYADRIVLPYRPRTVVLYAGDNDLNAGKTPERVHADFRAFVAKIHAALPKTKIVFIAIKPSPSRWKNIATIRAANALIAADCAKDPRLAYADIFTPMLGADGQPRPELFVKDMLHINAAGYALWQPVLAPLLKP